ncbi:hypothetical protein CDAR_1401 [Caerostris darwini]|uniref:Uncharacterized protein n=1 Tax=Caerostris darwini TaxID=1538125 RepID=A0AAV4TE86_9ARAC|nr:hypothetical protein CDAR_1401 [Caerostris darwini]
MATAQQHFFFYPDVRGTHRNGLIISRAKNKHHARIHILGLTRLGRIRCDGNSTIFKEEWSSNGMYFDLKEKYKSFGCGGGEKKFSKEEEKKTNSNDDDVVVMVTHL